MFSTVGDAMSTVGDTMMSVGDIMSTAEGVQYTGVSIHSIVFPMTFLHIMISPWCTHDTPQCTEYPLVYCTDIMQGDKVLKTIVH